MDDMRKQRILVACETFVGMLKEENVLITINVDKDDFADSTICFVDAHEFDKRCIDGISILLKDLNKWFGNKD